MIIDDTGKTREKTYQTIKSVKDSFTSDDIFDRTPPILFKSNPFVKAQRLKSSSGIVTNEIFKRRKGIK